jgi:hypothetical protein
VQIIGRAKLESHFFGGFTDSFASQHFQNIRQFKYF